MCRHRFGVLDDLYNELVSEGIDDVKMMGINGYQYINDSYACMICDPDATCNNCDDVRILPWTQDLDQNGDYEGDVWQDWNATIRDFVIVGRKTSNGRTFTICCITIYYIWSRLQCWFCSRET